MAIGIWLGVFWECWETSGFGFVAFAFYLCPSLEVNALVGSFGLVYVLA